MKYNCDLIQDLIPIYVDDALSDTSKKIVEDHFSECEECSKLFEEIKIEHERAIKKRQEYESQVEDFSRRIKKRRKRMLVMGIVACITVGILASIFITFKILDPFEYVAVESLDYVYDKRKIDNYIKNGKIPSIVSEGTENIALVYSTKDNRVNGRFHVSEKKAKEMKLKLNIATVDHLKMTKDSINGMYNEVKKTLEKLPQGVSYYQDKKFVYVFIIDGTVYYFGK